VQQIYLIFSIIPIRPKGKKENFYHFEIGSYACTGTLLWPYSKRKLELNSTDTKNFLRVCVLLLCTKSRTSGTQV